MTPSQQAAAQNAFFKQADFVIDTQSSIQKFLSQKNQYRVSHAMRLGIHLMSKIQIGVLEVILPSGQKLRFEGKEPGPTGILAVHNDRVIRRFLSKGKLGFCEAYLDGDWSSPDIACFFELILRNADVMRKTLLGKKWYRRLSQLVHLFQPNSKRGSQRNIYHHYDIGNDFYKAWLDRSMTYSSALFLDGIQDLEAAQERKYEEMVRRLDLKPEHHVLEIGCGWGGFAEYAARTTGCKVTAITISQAQHDYAVERMKNAGLQDKVTIALKDYRDLDGQYDRIASIEMFEAVGESYWPVFFETLKNRLKPGGHAALQIITIHDDHFENYRRNADYIQRYIFPGGMLPSMNALERQINAAGLKKGDHLSFGPDYAKTLSIWNKSFQNSWPNFKQEKFDTRFKRMWEQYLCYCQAGFAVGTIDVIQIAVHKD